MVRINKRGSIAITEIFILIVSIVAISWLIGLSIPGVSAQQTQTYTVKPGDTLAEIAGKFGSTVSELLGENSQITLQRIPESYKIDFRAEHGRDARAEDYLIPGETLTVPLQPQSNTQNEPSSLADKVKSTLIDTATGVATNEVVKWGKNLIGGGSEASAITLGQKNEVIKLLREQGVDEKVIQAFSKGTADSAQKEVVRNALSEASQEKVGFFDRWLFGKGANAAQDSLITGGVVGSIAVIWTFASTWYKTGDPKRAAEAAGRVAIGAGTGLIVYNYVVVGLLGIGPAGWIASGIVMLGVWASKYLQRTSDRVIDFQCKPWQPETGGNDCNECNDQLFPCTEYQCKSLGLGCDIINKNTDNPKCVEINPDDNTPPEIFSWTDVLDEGYRYESLPAERGVEIKYQNEECLPAFTPFALGIELYQSDKKEETENGYCKISFERTDSFEDMVYDFGGTNVLDSQHTQLMSFPGVANIQDYIEKLNAESNGTIEINNDGEYEFYVRCMSPNGISNKDEFLFKFCIDKGPDSTPPSMDGTEPIDGTHIPYFSENEERNLSVSLYVNEPSQCRWSHEDKEYQNMENNLRCQDNLGSYNSQLGYTCSGTLTGLQNSQENMFYFRCNDTFGNINSQSKELTLIGTQPLHISSFGPDNETIKDSTNQIKVTLTAETSAGEDEGVATCEYSDTGNSVDYVAFSNTQSFKHSTNLWLDQGDYNYYLRCYDNAGNSDNAQISFSVESDTNAPVTVLVYKEADQLKVITDEPSQCVYTNFGCDYLFEDGIEMSTVEGGLGEEHFTEWNSNRNVYIKCKDEFENRPSPNQCNIIVRPYDF